ncbi:MAG: restriction endonuclease subunit S [Proteobacteria bacterium]|nr:restriction endonuclease subunit S [Pseudomonadota bacterium]
MSGELVGSRQWAVGSEKLDTADCGLRTDKRETLPKGWIEIAISAICEHIRGVSYNKNDMRFEMNENYVPLLRANNINGSINHNELQYVPKAIVNKKQFLQKGDVVIAMSSGSKKVVGKTAPILEKWEGTFGAFCGVLRPVSSLNIEIFPYFFQTHYYRNKISELATGTNINNIKTTHFNDIDIPLPPINEQKRIVAKLDKIMPRIDSVKARLDKVPAIIKRFRQSVLTAAVSGKLTEKWREENTDVESAEILLERIKDFRVSNAENKRELNAVEKNYQEGEIRLQNKGSDYEFPETWRYCEINNIGNVYNGSTPSRKVKNYWAGNIHWVSSGEVANSRITDTREKITKSGFDNSSVKLLPKGTVLLAMIGEGKTRGQSAILDIESTCNQNVAAIVINHGLVLPEYLFNWLFMQYERNRSVGSGSGPKALNCQRVKELDFVLPPLKEQKEIVRQVDKLFALADKLEKHNQKAKARVDKLSQSVLAKAFRGELVPQDPNDEPAEKLLERIKKEVDSRQSAVGRKKRLQR